MRLFVVLSLWFILQLSLFSEARFLGVSPELPVLMAAIVGLHLGVERGTLVGFIIGLLYDIALGTPMGSWALVCCVAAYPLGAASATLDRTNGPGLWLVCGAISFGGIAGFAVVLWTVGQSSLIDGLVKVLVVATGYNMVLHPLVSRAIAWASPGGSTTRSFALRR